MERHVSFDTHFGCIQLTKLKAIIFNFSSTEQTINFWTFFFSWSPLFIVHNLQQCSGIKTWADFFTCSTKNKEEKKYFWQENNEVKETI